MSQSNNNDSAEAPMPKMASDLDRFDELEKKDVPLSFKKKAVKLIPENYKKINIEKITDRKLVDIIYFKKD